MDHIKKKNLKKVKCQKNGHKTRVEKEKVSQFMGEISGES